MIATAIGTLSSHIFSSVIARSPGGEVDEVAQGTM
jgi:hypothetical protein